MSCYWQLLLYSFPYSRCLPENDEPPLSTLAEGKSFPLIHPVNLTHCEARVPKTGIWESILTWVEYKQKKERERVTARQVRERAIEEIVIQVTQRERDRELKESAISRPLTFFFTRSYAQETQTLNMILLWIRSGGKKALKQAEFDLEKRSVKPTGITQHFEQLLELMKEEYLHQLEQTQSMSATLLEGVLRVFKEIHEEIPRAKHGKLYCSILKERLSNALDKILRLSSWTPSSTHNSRLRGLLRNALLTLNDLGGDDSEEYHHCLRDFMKRRTALCAFMMENANAINAEDSETTAELCKNLRRLAQNLGKIASTKAEQYEKLYEIFIANKEDLSHWLDSASPGQGKLCICFSSITFYI